MLFLLAKAEKTHRSERAGTEDKHDIQQHIEPAERDSDADVQKKDNQQKGRNRQRKNAKDFCHKIIPKNNRLATDSKTKGTF